MLLLIAENVAIYAEMVEVSDGNLKFLDQKFLIPRKKHYDWKSLKI